MINTASQRSNNVNGRQKFFKIINFKNQTVQGRSLMMPLFLCKRKLGYRFKSRRGYFQFFFFRFFSFVVFLPFGLFPFVLTADPFQLREIFAITLFSSFECKPQALPDILIATIYCCTFTHVLLNPIIITITKFSNPFHY